MIKYYWNRTVKLYEEEFIDLYKDNYIYIKIIIKKFTINIICLYIFFNYENKKQLIYKNYFYIKFL